MVEDSNNLSDTKGNDTSINLISVNSNDNYSRPKTAFILVTTLLIMILFSIRFVTICNTLIRYIIANQDVNNNFLNALIKATSFTTIFTFLSLVSTIITFVIIVRIRNNINNNTQYKVGKLSVISIINIALYSICLPSLINYYFTLERYYWSQIGDEYKINYVSFFIDMLACLVIIAFAIVNLVIFIKLEKPQFAKKI